MMNSFALSYELAYRREQLQHGATRRHSKDATRRPLRSWFARRRTITPVDSAPPAPLTLAVPAVGTAEFRDWATAVGHQFAERGVLAVRRELNALAQLAQLHDVAALARPVLTDRREHEVARAAAFLRVVTALQQLTPNTVISAEVAA